ELGHAGFAIDQDAQVRRLRTLAEQRDLVERMVFVHAPPLVTRAHEQRMDHRVLRGGEPPVQIVDAVFVHEKANGAAMHAVDRLTRAHVLVQRLQHEAVATERDDDVGRVRRGVAVTRAQPFERLPGLRDGTCNEGDPVVARGSLLAGAHAKELGALPGLSARDAGIGSPAWETRMNTERAVFVYTTYPSIVEAEAAGRALVERRLCA